MYDLRNKIINFFKQTKWIDDVWTLYDLAYRLKHLNLKDVMWMWKKTIEIVQELDYDEIVSAFKL